MSDFKSDREKKIDNFLKQFDTQKEWEEKMNNKIKKFYKNYKEELEDYIFIKNKKEYNKLKLGGYIRYINFNDELRWGGILLKKNKYDDMDIMVISNSNSNIFQVSFDKNYIFYKEHTTQADKTRKLFLSYLDKYDDN